MFLLVTLFFYALFLYFDLGNQWYEWSKTLLHMRSVNTSA